VIDVARIQASLRRNKLKFRGASRAALDIEAEEREMSATTAARLLHAAAGHPPSPKPTRPAAGPCYVCGETCKGEAVPIKRVCGPNFTDHDGSLAPWSQHVCVPCTWALSGRPPDTFRMWSVVYREDLSPAPSHPKAPCIPRAHLTNKADVSAIVDVLIDPPPIGRWFCSITSSGQVHTLPFAPVNVGDAAWAVRFERETVRSTPDEFCHVLHHASALLAAGFVRDDITTLNPHPSKLVKHGIETWRHHAARLEPYRTGNLLSLVIFLSRKEAYIANRDRTLR